MGAGDRLVVLPCLLWVAGLLLLLLAVGASQFSGQASPCFLVSEHYFFILVLLSPDMPHVTQLAISASGRLMAVGELVLCM